MQYLCSDKFPKAQRTARIRRSSLCFNFAYAECNSYLNFNAFTRRTQSDPARMIAIPSQLI